jgi:hypothetical protein
MIVESRMDAWTPDGRMSKGKFKSTKQQLVKRLSNWTGRLMSSGAKEVLIKSVAQAISTYIMGVFKLPDGMCEDLTQLIRKFWWGRKEGNTKYIGSLGRNYYCQRVKEDCDFGI